MKDGIGLARFSGIVGGGAFLTAACCFLPLMLMAAGAGTGVVALVGKASALALPLIGLSVLLLVAGCWLRAGGWLCADNRPQGCASGWGRAWC